MKGQQKTCIMKKHTAHTYVIVKRAFRPIFTMGKRENVREIAAIIHDFRWRTLTAESGAHLKRPAFYY